VDVQQAITLANRLGDPALRFSSRFHLTAMNYQEVDLASVDATLGEMDHLSEQIGLPNERWQLALLTTGRLLLDGRADDAEAANERALELGNASGSPDARASAVCSPHQTTPRTLDDRRLFKISRRTRPS
jgi:hypothetical protein